MNQIFIQPHQKDGDACSKEQLQQQGGGVLQWHQKDDNSVERCAKRNHILPGLDISKVAEHERTRKAPPEKGTGISDDTSLLEQDSGKDSSKRNHWDGIGKPAFQRLRVLPFFSLFIGRSRKILAPLSQEHIRISTIFH